MAKHKKTTNTKSKNKKSKAMQTALWGYKSHTNMLTMLTCRYSASAIFYFIYYVPTFAPIIVELRLVRIFVKKQNIGDDLEVEQLILKRTEWLHQMTL